MPTAALSYFRDRRSCFQLGDFYAKFRRTFYQVLPGASIRPLCGELAIERYGIVVVEQDEMVADRQFQPLFDDESVLDGAADRTHVHDIVRAGEVFSCRFHLWFGDG